MQRTVFNPKASNRCWLRLLLLLLCLDTALGAKATRYHNGRIDNVVELQACPYPPTKLVTVMGVRVWWRDGWWINRAWWER
jgi:hypothetical protein